MNKFSLFTFSTLAVLSLSCNKQIEPDNAIEQGIVETPVVKSFKVVMPETKVYLGDNAVSGKKLVKFEDGDQITIFANTTGNFYTGTYDASTDEFTTNITVDADKNESTFYAVYPATYKEEGKTTPITQDKAWAFTSGGTIAAGGTPHYSNIAAVKNGIESGSTILLAKTNSEGALTFSYGTAFLKIKVSCVDVKSIKFEAGGNGRYAGKPTYNNGTLIEHANSQKSATLIAESSFQENGVYYIPIIPKVNSKGVFQKNGNLTLTFTSVYNATYTITSSASAITDLVMTPGNIYDLGSPSIIFPPVIIPSNPSSFAHDATSGSFDYFISTGATLDNAVAVPYTETGYDALSLSSVSYDATSVSFECPENDGNNPRMAKIRLSYSGATDVDVVITQNKQNGSISTVYELYYNPDDNKLVNSQNYFKFEGTGYLTCDGSSNNFGVSSYSINGKSISRSRKLDGSNSTQFTTSSNVTATVRFYCASRTNSDASIGLGSLSLPNSGALTWTDSKADLYDSGEIALEANTTYAFSKNGPNVGIFYVIVTETPIQ